MSAAELELKGVVPDPAATRAALLAAGGTLEWAGLMMDRRYDRDGELAARGEVLRTRAYQPIGIPGGLPRTEVTWKGPTGRSADGYKERQEIELHLRGSDAPGELLSALGYQVVHAIDRRIEQYRVAGAMVRLEWYPRMDVLVEVEGAPAEIERAIGSLGIPRDTFLPDTLDDFVRRYDARHPGRAVVSLAELSGAPPSWELA